MSRSSHRDGRHYRRWLRLCLDARELEAELCLIEPLQLHPVVHVLRSLHALLEEVLAVHEGDVELAIGDEGHPLATAHAVRIIVACCAAEERVVGEDNEKDRTVEAEVSLHLKLSHLQVQPARIRLVQLAAVML